MPIVKTQSVFNMTGSSPSAVLEEFNQRQTIFRTYRLTSLSICPDHNTDPITYELIAVMEDA